MEFENNEESLYYYSSSSSLSSSTSSQTQLSAISPPPSSSPSRSQKKRSGRKKFREMRHPVYRGVRRRNGNKWVCEVREPIKKSRIWLGTYPTPEMAARAHDAAVLALRGTSATFNFPLSVPLLPLAESSSPQHIREAASKAAQQTSSNNDITNPPVSSSNMNLSVGVDGGGGVGSRFFDEEAMFNMPALLDSMAEGLLITPPSMKRGAFHDDDEFQTDLTLWNFD
ncbi:dehydration-responsive element-binding protein 1F-like [Arachis stenosperma]|uniref:dehydration-responsive element-binding protein 1F-like n=1 Tax=Arachis stenosperma TaxID=217475 RepID=UPI0025ACDED3|nr:dehydration-responsive element-binding protein 1F-like [Arachis stenosperma]